MKIGFLGLGKLGLPVAVATANRGHDVIGYDINDSINSKKHPKEILFSKECDEFGKGSINTMIENTKLKIVDDMDSVIEHSEIIFIAIQTPHKKQFEGCDIMPEEREDFDYSWIISCMKDLSSRIDKLNVTKIVSIISTVLPGTLRKLILPITSKKIHLCYNPFFIAMGTVVYDFYNPEIVLLGYIDEEAHKKVIEFYKTITNAEVYSTSLENAEMIKVSYNTFITTKIVLANNIMEMCNKLPNTNCDEVMDALKKSDRRLISKAYLSGGMGDGGGCHPRDNIAMSWLSNKLGIKNNYYDFIMKKRESQTEFFVDIIEDIKKNNNQLEICILGMSFKPETNMTIGSPAVLLKNMLKSKNIDCITYDPHLNTETFDLLPRIYFLGCRHSIFKTYKFHKDSIIIDPFRYINLDNGCKVIKIGVCS